MLFMLERDSRMIDFGQDSIVDDYRALEWLFRMGGEASVQQFRVDRDHDLGMAADFECVELWFAKECCLCPVSPNLTRMLDNGWVEFVRMNGHFAIYRIPSSIGDHHAWLADLRGRIRLAADVGMQLYIPPSR
jgi:hypothetical protein